MMLGTAKTKQTALIFLKCREFPVAVLSSFLFLYIEWAFAMAQSPKKV